MKKYSIEWLTDVRRRPRGLTRATKVKPFPGKYPTRIAWSVKVFGGGTVSYVGKPSRRALQRFRSHLKTPGYLTGWAVEFDRNGLIAKDGGRPGTLVNANLRSHYHPYGEHRVEFYNEPGRWITYPETIYTVGGVKTVKRRMYWPLNEPLPQGATA